MAIKFERIQPGMRLWDRHRERAGNTTMTRLGEWPVDVVSVDSKGRTAVVRWNCNAPETYHERRLTKLYTWRLSDRAAPPGAEKGKRNGT